MELLESLWTTCPSAQLLALERTFFLCPIRTRIVSNCENCLLSFHRALLQGTCLHLTQNFPLCGTTRCLPCLLFSRLKKPSSLSSFQYHMVQHMIPPQWPPAHLSSVFQYFFCIGEEAKPDAIIGNSIKRTVIFFNLTHSFHPCISGADTATSVQTQGSSQSANLSECHEGTKNKCSVCSQTFFRKQITGYTNTFLCWEVAYAVWPAGAGR